MKISANRCHYIKFSLSLDEDISIRYHFTWQDKQEMERKYVLKHHSLNLKTIIDDTMALGLISKYCTREEEIVSHVIYIGKKREHRKIIISDKTINQVVGGKVDKVLKSSKIIKEWVEL